MCEGASWLAGHLEGEGAGGGKLRQQVVQERLVVVDPVETGVGKDEVDRVG